MRALPAVTIAVALSLTPAPASAQPQFCGSEEVTIAGTERDDRLRGTPGRDVISGFGGDDLIAGRRGNDVVCDGPGDDVVRGGRGADRITNQDGDDALRGGRGADRVGKTGSFESFEGGSDVVAGAAETTDCSRRPSRTTNGISGAPERTCSTSGCWPRARPWISRRAPSPARATA